LKKFKDLLVYLLTTKLVYGLGISVTSNNYDVVKPLLEVSNNIVYHMIVGVNNLSQIDELIERGKNSNKFLILGYKRFGRGVGHFSDSVVGNLKRWKFGLQSYFGVASISFDNLAIDQLSIKSFMTESEWNSFYMGDDFTFTMYIDAISQEFGPTSTSDKSWRKSFSETTLFDYFQKK
jgi:hypothetical protein